MSAPERCSAARRCETGSVLVVLLITLTLLGAGGAAMMFKRQNVDIAAQDSTADALGFARDALIAYSSTQGTAVGLARPGDFPCPDMDNDGRAEASCAVGALGRLPWITLGIPAPKDAAGETLWYAVALPFRNRASNPNPINSDTLGSLSVRVAGSAVPVTTQAVAVVLAPGAPVGGQNRTGQGAVTCAATGASVPPSWCVSNYLEAFSGVDNSAANGPFINVPGNQPSTFNDRLTYIRTSDFMPAVEQRVGAELRDMLLKYREGSTCDCYPYAADWAVFTGQAISGRNRGRFPTLALPHAWGSGGTPLLPQWVAANNWQNVIYYSAAKGQLELAGSLCTSCTSSTSLTVAAPSGADSVSALLMTPGTPIVSVARPSATLAHYFEDAQNNRTSLVCPASGTIPAACDAYVEPTARTLDRDRLLSLTTDATLVTCANAGIALASIGRTTTCGGPGNTVIASCKVVVSQLSRCTATCKSAAAAMIKPPCYNVSNKPNTPPQCASALYQLEHCL